MFDTEAPPRPRLSAESFDRIATALASDGAGPAVEKLLEELRQAGDYDDYFYALLMKKRIALGVSPFPAGSVAELPDGVHQEYENSIRDSGREVGRMYLEKGDIPKAWVFFRMLGESEPIRDAIEKYDPDPEADCEDVIQIAFHQGVHPKKGFDMILERYGICSAITMVSGQDFSQHEELHEYCVKGLVHDLAEQLADRLRVEITEHGDTIPETAGIREMIEGRDWLFADEAYHIDVSHLSSVVQMSLRLPECEELKLARELCTYGEKLAEPYQGSGDMPFEETYKDFGIYLDVLINENVDHGIEHFRKKADEAAEEGYSFPTEVAVNLMCRAKKYHEAIALSRKHLLDAGEQELSCPGVYELCHKANDYNALAEIARERGEGVPFLAALVNAKK